MLQDLPPINATAALKWINWCDVEQSKHARTERAEAEAHFLECVNRFDADEIRGFTEYWCPLYLGEINPECSVPMRFALIHEVIAPVLEQGRLERRPYYARWSAGLYALLHKTSELNKSSVGLPCLEELFKEALAVDPSDDLSRRMWLLNTARALDYDFHELPMLLSSKDALLSECALLERLARELSELEFYSDWLEVMRDLIKMDKSERSWERYRSARPEWI